MLLADWSGRRVAAYAILWLVGFPVVMTVFAILSGMAMSGSGGFMFGMPGVELGAHAAPDPMPRAVSVDTAYFSTAIPVDTSMLRAHHGQSRPGRQLVFLPAQHSDVSVQLSVSEVTDVGTGFDYDLLTWLLPPALLVAAWAWTRRSRPDPG